MNIKQPSDFIVNTPNGTLSFNWNPAFGRLTEEKLNTAQKVIDQQCIELMKPYTPFRNGFLEQSATLGTVIGSGEIQQIAPYARYLYYGEVYGPNIPIFEKGNDEPIAYFSPPGQSKYPTGKQMEYDTTKHKLAGKLWFERMKSDRKDDILRAAAKSIGADIE